MNLKGFVKECHKKEVFKMLSIYIVSSWLILQVLAVIAEPLGLPQKSVTYLILILLIGFPIYIYYMWKFKLLKYEIQQTEDPNTPYNKSAFQKMYFSSLFVITIMSVLAASLIINNNFIQDIKLRTIKSNDKIAVLEFTNNTGDKDLDIIGKMTANWIVHGITKNKIAQVISPKIVNDYTSVIKSQATANITELLKTYFKPSKIIDGNFYKQDNKLFLEGSIKDGLINETYFTFETIECDSNSPLDCAEKLKQNILGYLIIEDKKDVSGYILNSNQQKVSYYEETPPNLKAYQYLTNANENYNNQELFIDLINKAIAADSNFFEPKVHEISYYYNKGDFKIADSLRQIIALNSKLSDRQRNHLSIYESALNGKNDKAYRYQKNEYNSAPLDRAANMTTMTIALQYVNRPEDIEDIFDVISMKELSIENCPRCGFRYYMKGLADVELGNYNNAISMLLPLTNIIEANYLKRPLLSAYIKSGDYITLDKYLSDLELKTSPDDLAELLLYSGKHLIIANQKDKADIYFNKIIALKNEISNSSTVAGTYYYKEDYSSALKLFRSLLASNAKSIDNLVHLSISNFNSGNFTEAKKLILTLDQLKSDYQFGEVDYGWAKYYAAVGDKDKSLEYLLKAVSQGYNYTHSTFHNDPHFKMYKDTPEFKQILNYWHTTI